MGDKKQKKNIEFEQALKELEEITSRLAGGDLSLKESLKLYERGINLKKICKDKLGKAANRIKILKDSDGELKEEDFNIKDQPDNNL